MAIGAPFYCICAILLLLPQPGLDSVEVSIWSVAATDERVSESYVC